MRAFAEIVWLELRSLVRSKALATLLALAVAWMLALPGFIRSDGTAESARELYVRFSLGGAFVLTLLALLASATGSLARERAAHRLPLTMVRPVSRFSIAFGKIVAHVAVGALVLSVAGAILAGRSAVSRPCFHVVSPVLPSVREEARDLYETYLRDPATPDALRRERPEVVLRLLEGQALDRYQSIPTNVTAKWRFPGEAIRRLASPDAACAVRMRLAARFDMRRDVRGAFRLGAWQAPVSNITQAVLSVPLERASDGAFPEDELLFRNDGGEALMLRPRRDLALLVRADSFGWNLVRSCVALLAILAVAVSFGVFLSAGLGRPVALFAAVVTLVVGEMSPSVISSCPETLDSSVADRVGLAVTRVVAQVARPVSAASPLEALANDERVETGALLRLVVTDLAALPILLAWLAAVILPRKQEEGPFGIAC